MELSQPLTKPTTFEDTLSRMFPPRLGMVPTVDASIRRELIEAGALPVYTAEDFAEVPYKVWEWQKTRWERVR